MLLRIYSDLHLEFSGFTPPPDEDPDVVILAGDIAPSTDGVIWARETFRKPTLYVPGNHEFYAHGETIDQVITSMRREAEDTPVSVLIDEQKIIDGVRFLGTTLWTDYELLGRARKEQAMMTAEVLMSDFVQIRYSEGHPRLTALDTLALHVSSRHWLEEALSVPFDGSTVVITHHAPSIQSITGRHRTRMLSAAYASDMHAMIERFQPALWVHGHTHQAFDYRVNTTRVICNPRGYVRKGVDLEDTGFDPEHSVSIA